MSARKPYFKTCPHCGANLDPGERCSCSDQQEKDRLSKLGEKKTPAEMRRWVELTDAELKPVRDAAFQVSNSDYIRQILWLLERTDKSGLIRVLSYANRLFVTGHCVEV